MGFFSPNYLKEGKGVRKDEPKKTGIMRLFEIIARDMGDLFKLNIIYLICCIPIVTIGPATVALSAVITKRVRDIPCYVFHEFKTAFKENFKRAFGAGLLVALLLAICGVGAFFYSSWNNTATGAEQILTLMLSSITILMLVIIMIASNYLFTLIAVVDLPLKQQLKNALLLTVAFLPRSGLILITTAPIWAATILFFPFTIPCFFVYHFSLINLIVNMNVWAVIEKVFVNNNDESLEQDDAKQ